CTVIRGGRQGNGPEREYHGGAEQPRMRDFPHYLPGLQAPRSTHREHRAKHHADKQDCPVNHSRSVDLEVIALHCKPGVPAKQRTLGAKLAAVLAVSEAEEITPHFPPVRNEPDRRGGGG